MTYGGFNCNKDLRLKSHGKQTDTEVSPDMGGFA